jgi:orotidine-5'-phosphate decarboxylase
MAVVGDRVQILSRKVGEAPRDGVVTGVTGSLLRVRWSTGEESTVVPSMGSLTVVGKQSGSGGPKQKTKSASAAKGPVRR